MVALLQYDGGEALNVTMMLLPPGSEIDFALIPTMHWQSGLFGRGTQNLVLRNQLGSALSALDRELQTVGEIQRSLLPGQLPSITNFELSAYYQMSARAGGDYYDFFPLDNGCWGLFIADVSGHGTPAAVLMAITHAIAHAQPETHTPPAALLTYLNQQLARVYTHGGTFVTAFYGVLDPARRTMVYARAGHNPPRLVRDGRIETLDRIGALPLGVVDAQTYDEASVVLSPGDLLLLFTDGIIEATSPADGSQFGVDRLDRVLVQCRQGSTSECIRQIQTTLTSFCENAPLADDQTVIAMRCIA